MGQGGKGGGNDRMSCDSSGEGMTDGAVKEVGRE